MTLFRLGGLIVASDYDLPVLPRGADATAAPDVTVHAGPVPETLDGADSRGLLMEARGGDTLLLRIPRVARFLVLGGREVVVEAAPGADQRDVAAHLTGVVQTALWHQRGLLPLHAAVVEVGGRAVALAGPSTAGKSTLAAALAARGHGVLADDVCVVDLAGGAPMVLPTVGPIRLWPDSVGWLGHDPATLPRALGVRKKYLMGAPTPLVDPLPLAAVLVLSVDARLEHGRLEPLHGSTAHLAMVDVVQRRRMARLLGVQARCFQDAAVVAGAVAVARLWRPRASGGFMELATLAESILAE